MVQQIVRHLIGKEPNQNVNPDEVVAVGAAIQAGILAGELKDVLLLDVTPLSVGLETISGVTKKLIPRNTTIPVRRSDIFSTAQNNQTMVEIHVLQGEREMAVDNKSLGRFKLTGIAPAPRGVPQVQVAFDVDANGILLVTALDRTTGREQSITIQGASTLSETEVNRMIQEAEEYTDIDRERKERVEKRTRADALTLTAERRLKDVGMDFGMQFARGRRQRIESLIREVRDSLAADDDRGIDQSYADLQEALSDLNREVRQYYSEEDEDDDLFGSIRRVFTGDDDREPPKETLSDAFDGSRSGYRAPYGRESRDRPYSDEKSRRSRPSYQDNWDDEDDNWL
jgi:molecular chaperone DnaK